MRFALSKNAVDLLGELLQAESNGLSVLDPDIEGCFLDKDELAERKAALSELQDLAHKYEWDETDTEACVKACDERLSYAEWKDSLEQEWWFERWKNEIEDMPNGSPEKEDEWDKYVEAVEEQAELAVQMQDEED